MQMLRLKHEGVYSTQWRQEKTDDKRGTKIRPGSTTNIDDLFINQVGGSDEAFWGNYNYIKPDENLEDALKRIEELTRKEQ